MAADETTVIAAVTDILNLQAPGTWSGTIAATNLDRNETAISEAVRKGALMVARAIVANPQHVHRGLFVASSPVTLTHGAEMPDLAGETDLIQVQAYDGATAWKTATKKDVQQIEDWRENVGNVYQAVDHDDEESRLSGFYGILDGRVYFTGFAARCYPPRIDRDTVTGIIPDEYEPAWTAASVGCFTLKEGDNLDGIVGFYRDFALAELASITNMGILQPLPPADAARKGRGNV